VAKIDLNSQIPNKTDKLYALTCEGLMNRCFSTWIQTLIMKQSEVKRCYAPEALLRSPAVPHILEVLGFLSGLPFSLNYLPVIDEERR